MPATIKINSGSDTGYSIKIQHGLIERLGIEILRFNESVENEILIITDEEISALYLQSVLINFHGCPKPEDMKVRICEILINSDEAKNFSALEKLLEKISEFNPSKNCVIAALGSEAICNASAFAALCCGGLRLVLVPTSVEAMINSVKGCASLRLSGKKQAEIFFTPSLILCDIDSLKTLTPDKYKRGIDTAFNISKESAPELVKIFERGEANENIEKIIEVLIKKIKNIL